MKIVMLADGVTAAATGVQTGVLCNKTPTMAGRDCVARINFGPGVTGTPVVKVQGSVDAAFTTPVDLLVSAGLADKQGTVICMPYMRANVTTAAGAGLFSASIENGV